MGNKHCQLTIQLDRNSYKSGEIVEGKVFLKSEVDADTFQQTVKSLEVCLEGKETTQITKQVDDPEHIPKDGERRRKIRRPFCSEHIFVQLQNTVVTFGASSPLVPHRYYEYPLRLQIPENLPSSVRISEKEGNVAEIVYRLYVTLQTLSRHSKQCQAATVFELSSQPTVSETLRPIVVPVKVFPITTALLWSKGDIAFGFQTDRAEVCPGSTIHITIEGYSHCKVSLKDFSVRVIQQVSFRGKQSGSHVCQTETTVVSESAVSDATVWNGPSCPKVALTLPSSSDILRDSYQGKLLQITHSVLIVAQTAKSMTTNPKQKTSICVVRNSSMSDSSRGNEWTSTGLHNLPVAQPIPFEECSSAPPLAYATLLGEAKLVK